MEDQPLIGIAAGTHAEKVQLIELLRRRLRFPKSYARVLRWYLDSDADHRPMSAQAKAIARSPWVDVSEKTVERANRAWESIGVLAFDECQDDNGAWLPPRAELVWDAVLDHLGVSSSRGNSRNATSGAPTAADVTPVGRDAVPGRQAAVTLDPAAVPGASNGSGSAVTRAPRGVPSPPIRDHSTTPFPQPSPTYGRGGDRRTICRQGVATNRDLSPGGGDMSPGGGDTSTPRLGGGGDRFEATSSSSPNLLARVWRTAEQVLAGARATVQSVVVRNTTNDCTVGVSVGEIAALADQASERIWPEGLHDTVTGRQAQRLLYASAFLALTQFSRGWFSLSVDAFCEQRRAKSIHNPVPYLAGCFRNQLSVVEDLAEEEATRNWWAKLQGLAERATAAFLPALPAKTDQTQPPRRDPTDADRREAQEVLRAARAALSNPNH